MNCKNSVRVHPRIKMKLRSVFLVLLFGVLGLVEIVSGLCLVKNTATSNVFLYACFMSTDYLIDVQKAPIDITRVSFTNSKITVLKNGSFTRLGKYLERLIFLHCGIEDIEDNAFQGLTKLDTLGFGGNKLKVVKSAWFKGLSSLETVSFENNGIKRMEDDFFSIVPPLKLLDISVNEITCLPVASFGNFNTTEFHFRQNRLTPMCQALLFNWLKEKKVQNEYPALDYFDTHYDVTKICIDKLPKAQLDETFLNKCVEDTTRDLLPAEGNYTVKQVCELLKDTPSPFLNCSNS